MAFFWTKIMYGFVYLLANEAMPQYYKIGYTDKSPRQRARELSNTSVPFDFQIVCYGEVLNAYETEKELHKLYQQNRINLSREFFQFKNDELFDVCISIKEQTDFFVGGEIYEILEYNFIYKGEEK